MSYDEDEPPYIQGRGDFVILLFKDMRPFIKAKRHRGFNVCAQTPLRQVHDLTTKLLSPVVKPNGEAKATRRDMGRGSKAKTP